MSAKVSIIVPVYNVERYLDKCVSSLINQTLQEIEIILVDDGSPDNSPKMCEEYALKDSRIKVIHKANAGLGYARNSGLEIATGEYVAFLDSDDFVDNDTYRLLYELSTNNNLNMLLYRLSRFNTENELITGGNSEVQIYDNHEELKQIALSYFSQTVGKLDKNLVMYGSSCCYLYNRKFLINNNLKFYSERELISEDYIFNFDALQKVDKVGKINKILYFYRVTSNSLTTTVKLNSIDRCIKFCKFVANRFVENGYPKESEIYAMGYYISRLRIQTESVITSNEISNKEKLDWLKSITNSDYFNYVNKIYPKEKLERKYKLYIYCISNKSYNSLKIAIKIKRFLKTKFMNSNKYLR